MKNWTILFIFFSLEIVCLGQSTFSHSYGFGISGEIGVSIKSVNEEVIITGLSTCKENQRQCLLTLRIDSDGNIIWVDEKNRPARDFLFAITNKSILITEDIFYVNVGASRGRYSSYGILALYNMNGDSLKSVQLEKEDKLAGGAILKRKNDSLLLYNYQIQGFQDDKTSSWLMNLDLQGNLIWEKEIGTEFALTIPLSVYEYPNKDILLMYQACEANSRCSINGWNFTLTRTDPHGETKWTKPYHKAQVGATYSDIIPLEDDKIVVNWVKDNSVATPFRFPPVLLWIDSTGMEYHRYEFPANHSRYINTFFKAKNGDLIGVGSKELLHFGDLEIYITGWVFRMSPEGELLWERELVYDRSPIKNSYFTGGTETNDGYLVLTGAVTDTFPESDTIPYYEDPNVWLVKLDSLGCLAPGCDTRQVITNTAPITLLREPDLIAVFPNPTSGQVTIQVKSDQLQYPVTISMYSSQGRQVYQGAMDVANKALSLEGFPGGLYYLQLKDGKGKIVTEKLVKQF